MFITNVIIIIISLLHKRERRKRFIKKGSYIRTRKLSVITLFREHLSKLDCLVTSIRSYVERNDEF